METWVNNWFVEIRASPNEAYMLGGPYKKDSSTWGSLDGGPSIYGNCHISGFET